MRGITVKILSNVEGKKGEEDNELKNGGKEVDREKERVSGRPAH